MLKFEAPKGPAQRDKACVYGSSPENFGCVLSSMHANTGMLKSGSGKLKGSESKALEPFDHPRGLCSSSCEAEQGARPRLPL